MDVQSFSSQLLNCAMKIMKKPIMQAFVVLVLTIFAFSSSNIYARVFYYLAIASSFVTIFSSPKFSQSVLFEKPLHEVKLTSKNIMYIKYSTRAMYLFYILECIALIVGRLWR